jgi:hypothetical protein
MKTLILTLILSLITIIGLVAQTSTDEFNQATRYYEDLAVKLYPDSSVAGSPLVNLMIKMDAAMKANQSRLYNFPSKPLLLAAQAASVLKIQPHWEAVTEGERNVAFNTMTDGLISSRDLTPPAVAQVQAAPPKPFNPGSIDDAIASSKTVTPQVASAPADPNLKPTRNGYLYFYNDLVNKSGDLMGQKNGPVIYRSGPMRGMTPGQGKAYAQQQWQALSTEQQIACEQNAQTYGPGPDPDAPSTTHTYNFQPNGMGGGTITGQ